MGVACIRGVVCMGVAFRVASVVQEYRDTHHNTSSNGGLKILDYCVKKRTDQLNNSINTYVARLLAPPTHY